MRRALYLLVAAVAVCLLATAGSASVTPSGLVAAYGFDEGTGTTLGDSSGHNNDGVISGATWSIGRFGKSLVFDGIDDWVTVADSASLDLTDGMTIEAWVLPTELGSEWRTVAIKEQPGDLSYALYGSGKTAGVPSGHAHVGTDIEAAGPAPLPRSTWSHVATTFDGASLRLYVNGTLVSTVPAPGNLTTSSSPFRLGGNEVWEEWFKGRIDEVRVYSRALDAAGIASDMRSGVVTDSIAPQLVLQSPAAGAIDVPADASFQATFSEAMSPATITSSTITVRDGGGTAVPATVTFDELTSTATIHPTAALSFGTTYSVTVGSGATDRSGNPVGAHAPWTIATQTSAPPLLLITSAANPFSSYYGEILRAEGLNLFTTAEISSVSPAFLAQFHSALLGEMTLGFAQESLLSNWVNAGGNLVAMRPDKDLAGLLGLTATTQTLANAYLKVDTTASPGAGIVGETMQFHGTADVYTLNGATQVAELFSTATAAHGRPAVSLVDVGSSGGQAAAFTYDLAKSIVYTRQGNPAWAGQDRDGVPPIRPHDLFFGGAEADWVDLSKVGIPQADEQQRLLANLLAQLNTDEEPLPRFWYLPRGEKAAIVMTGDDHGFGGTALAFDRYRSQSAAGCNVALWECVRSTSYIYPNAVFTDTQAAAYTGEGFEVALHVSTDCVDYTPASLEDSFDSQLGGFVAAYPGAGVPETNRTHCIAWSDWAKQPKVELEHGIRFDTNYYYYPGSWVQNRPGLMTGSAMPMRFADTDGSTIDVYQAATQMTDESGQAYPFTSDALLDKATGPEGYYGVYTVNAHTDSGTSVISDPIVASAAARGVPVVSSLQMLRWLDGRTDSSFHNFSWVSGTLRFALTAAAGSDGLQALLPLASGRGTVTGITRNGAFVPFATETIKGVDYAAFSALGGEYTILFDTSSIPVVTQKTPGVDESGVPSVTTVTARFSTALNPATITDQSFTLVADGTGASVPAVVTYDSETRTATLTPNQPLAHSARYTASLATTILGASGSPFAGLSWGFGTGLPTVESSFPSPDATSAPRSARVRVTFTSALDPTTITGASFTLETAAGAAVAGAVSYDAAARTASLDPTLDLVAGTSYVVTLTAAIHAADGTPLVPATWTFATTSCPCSLFPSSASPAIRGIATGGTPLELGVKIRVDEPVVITALRYYKDSPLETGQHVGHIWKVTGEHLASVTFVENTTSSGWQQKSLQTPLALAAGTYVFSVNANNRWGTTQSGLQSEIVSGPIRTVADGVNGVFADTAGTFPTSSFSSSNYFVDLVAVAQGELVPPNVESTTPLADATDVGRNPIVSATFSPLLDPATIDDSTFTLRPAGGSVVPATVTYDTATGTALLTPTTPLLFGTSYTATMSTGVESTDGTPMTVPYSWTFTMRALPPAPTVVLTVPAPNANDLGVGTTPRAVFDRALDPATVVGANFTLTGPGGSAIPAVVSYDPATLAAILDPVGPLTLGATYTATLSGAITAEDGGTLGTPHVWSFTVAATDPGPPTLTGSTPPSGATGVLTDTNVTASFSRSMDPGTIGAGSFTLTPAGGGAPLPATVTYNAATATATLDPAAVLMPGATYTAALSTAIKAADGTALAAAASWSFTTASCPCSLFQTTLVPTSLNLSTANGRPGAGPFSLELGAKIRVDRPSLLRAVRFYKDAGETGAHTITLWTPDGAVKLREIAFSGETASGWQTQALATAYSLEPGNDYVVSVNANDRWVSTLGTFASEIVSGPVHSVVGGNGVYAETSGVFPTLTHGASNYFVDVVVDPNPVTPGPSVVARTPAAAATDAALTSRVEARFSRGLAVSTISSASFTLQAPGGVNVPAVVAYTAATNTAVLIPSVPLEYDTTYTATLSTAISAIDGAPLDATDTWTFTTLPAPPTVLETSPGDTSVEISTSVSPTATFSQAMDPDTITAASFTLTPFGGTVSVPATVTYDDLTHTATLDPTDVLTPGARFVARLDTAIENAVGVLLESAFTWTFDTNPDVTPPSVPTLDFSGLTAAMVVDSTVYFRPSPTGGGFTVLASSSDPETGITGISYPTLGTGWSGTDGVYSFSAGASAPVGPTSVTATNGAGLTASAPLAVAEDSTPPVGGSITYPTGYDSDGVVSLVVDPGTDAQSGLDPATLAIERQLSALADGACAAFAGAWEPAGETSTVPDGSCVRFRTRISDRLGNEAVHAGGAVLVDLTAPGAPALTLSDASAAVHTTATTAFYRPTGSGSFDVTASATDAQSGIFDYSFPALAGFTGSGAGATTTYTLATPTEADGAKPVTARNNALLSSPTSSFVLTADSTAPSGGALTVNDLGATVAGTSGYDVDGAFSIARTDYDADSGSGVATSVLTRETGTLSAGVCSSYGAPAALTGMPAQAGLATGCYRYVLTAADNVGNAVSISTVVKVDTSDPITPTLTLSDSSADVHIVAGTVFYRPAGSGSFDVAASSDDGDSGIASYSFPALAGFTSSGSAATRSYTLATPAEADGAKPVTAQNNAGRTSTSNFTLSADSTAPLVTIACTGGCAPWHTTTPVSVSLGATDASGSGPKEIRYTTDNSDPTTGTIYSTALSFSVTTTVRWAAFDQLGNVALGSQLVQIDTTAPDTTIATGPTDPSKATNASFAFRSSEAGSSFECRLDGGAWAACASPQAYSGLSEATHTFEVRATDEAGNADPSAAAYAWTIDTTAPETTITAKPADPTKATDATFAFSSSETGSGFEVRLDGGAWSAGTSPKSYSGLAAGSHTFEVHATDAAGNKDTTAATYTWTIDTTAPETTIDVRPADPTNATGATLAFSSSEAGSGFDVRLDGGAWIAATSPTSFSGLAQGSRTFEVRATDTAGNTDSTPASFTWVVDTTNPTGSVTSPTSEAQVRGTIALTSDSADAGGSGVATVQFQRSPAGGANWTNQAASWSTTGAADGRYDLRVVTTDHAGNSFTSAAITVRVDNTAPDTTITAGPADPTSATGATFSFTSSEADGTFECRIDGGAWGYCASPTSYSGLAEGSHIFDVRATDTAGNTDLSPATSTWNVDTTPPDTTITANPADPTNATTAAFSFTSTAAGSTFEVRLDGGSWSPSTSPKSYSLSEGPHTFDVRATDAAGNTDPSPATLSWTVDTTAPDTSITSHPADPTNSSGAAFSVSSTEAGSTFECRLDGGSWIACASAHAYASLTEGAHTFEARATDAATNTDASPASLTWVIDWTSPTGSVTAPAAGAHIRATYLLASDSADIGSGVASVVFERRAQGSTGAWIATPASYDTTLAADGLYHLRVVTADVAGNVTISSSIELTVDNTPPETTITSSPADPTNDTGASFSFTSNEPGGAFECRRDGGVWSACTSPKTYTGLSEASHTFEVRSTDLAGNVDATAATYVWTIDTTAPVTSITTSPADPTNSTDASFSFNSNEAGSTFEVRLDGGAWSAGTTPKAYSGLAEGSHSFDVRATDPATNTDATPASYTWTVDTTAPDTSIATKPANPSSDRTPALTFSSTATPATFECNLDGAGWSPCATPFTISPALADGSHTLEVRSTDAAGNQDGSMAAYTWVVDGTNPTGAITTPNAGAAVSGATVAVASDSTDAASGVLDVLFERRAAGAGSWTAIGPADTSAPYSVSWNTTGLAEGDYELRATTRDLAGNQFVSAARTITVDNIAPTLVVDAPAIVNLATADPTSITATATDAGTGVTSVNFEQCNAANDNTCTADSWKPLGLDTTLPYGVAWPLPSDGTRLLRVRATDGASHQTTRLVLTTVDRTGPAGAVTAPTATYLRGASVTLAANASDTAPGAVDTVTFQRSPAGAGAWAAVQTDTAAPYDATLDTTALADGLYDFRVVVTDLAGNTTNSAPVTNRRVDNTAPSATMVDPGDYLRGASVALTSTQSDAGSGIATVVIQRQGSTGGWVDTPTSFDTTGVADGLYDFRVVVTDLAGNTTNSAPVANRRVDNTAPSATMLDPGAFLRGSVALTSSRSDAGSGIATAVYQRRAGAGSWVDTSETFDTTAVADGLYDFRVVVTDRAGNTTTSAAVTGRRVDNTAPTATIVPVAALIRDTVTLAGSGTDAGSGVAGTTFERRLLGDPTLPWTATPAVWDTKTTADGKYELRAVVADNAGNSTPSAPVTTQIDNTGPRIVSQSPVDAATNVNPELVPSITFSRAMDAASFTATSVILKKADGTVVSANRSYNGAANTLYIAPLWPLDYVTTYVVTLDTTVKAQDGIPLAVPFAFSFTTTGTGTNKRVNSGGPALTTLVGGDFLGATFLADGSVSGGLQRSTTNVISGTTDPALYRDERYGSFTYTIKVPNGTYDVILHFAEWNAVAVNTHVFGMDVLETAATDIPSLDLTSVIGRNKAYKRTIANVTTSTSSIRVRSIPISLKGDPTIAAIEVISKR